MPLQTPSVGKIAEYFAYISITFLVLFYGFYSGLNNSRATVEAFFFIINIAFIDAISSSIFFTFFIVLTGSLLLKEIYSKEKIKYKYNSGEITAIVPVYRDSEALKNSVKSLKKSKYKDLNPVVVCEPEDKDSIEAAKNLPCNVIINKYPGSKAGAINTAFEKFNSDYFAIFDADEIIDPDFLPAAIGSIESGYDAFQGRRIPIPTGVVEGFSYCERVLFHSAYKISELSGFRNLRSSSTVMKKEVWEEVGGYEDLLTEDLDFPHKCFRSGIEIRQDRRVTNLMEAPHSWRDFWNQRKRWRMGQVQILHKALKRGYPRNFSYRGMVSLGRLIFSIIVGFLILTMIPKFLILFLLDLDLVFLMPLVTSIVLVAAVSVKDYLEGKVDFIGWKAFMTPLVFVVTGFLAVKSVLEYAISWDGKWYEVKKKGPNIK